MTNQKEKGTRKTKQLRGKNCLLTGAASGIGRSLAFCLAKEKVNLFLVDIDMENLESVKKKIEPSGVKVIIARCDVSKYEEFEQLAEKVYSQLGDIDILINNAGISGGGNIETIGLEHWKHMLDVNLWSIIYSVKVFLPRMLERGKGYIINTGSGAGVVGLPNHISYVTSKFAVVGMSEALYSELSHRGIDVSVICPTTVKTNIIDRSTIEIDPNLLQIEDEADKERKMEEFRKIFWEIYMRKSLTPDQAASRYIKGIKRRKLYIFDKKIVPLAMFFKAISQSTYKRVLRKEGSDYRAMIDEALTKIGVKN